MESNNLHRNTKRIIIDSQSNPHFLGLESEQDYDQRAPLAQGRAGDIVVTTNPIDPAYVQYWKKLGYSIPTLLTAGPFEKDKVLSQLIFEKNEVRAEIMSLLDKDDSNARLEFFTPTEKEESLAKQLEIPTYLNFDFAKEMQKKSVFKKLCEEINISFLPYIELNTDTTWGEVLDVLGENESGYIAKHIFGTGGAGLGTIIPIKSQYDFAKLNGNPEYIIEKLISVEMEVSVHWEIDFDRNIHFIHCFEQLAENVSYVGAVFPTKIPDNLWNSILAEYKVLTEKIADLGGIGFMCCDILVDENGKFYWSDLNPRKGAILFAYDSVMRFIKNHNLAKDSYFVRHRQIKSRIRSFKELECALEHMIVLTKNSIVIVTNPGVIRHGVVDLTAISFLGHEHASHLIKEAEYLIK